MFVPLSSPQWLGWCTPTLGRTIFFTWSAEAKDLSLSETPYRHLHAQSLNRVQLFVNPWTVAHQAPLSTEFSRQEYKPMSLASSALASRFFTTSTIWEACYRHIIRNNILPYFILSVTECILRQWIGIIFFNLSTYSGVLGLTPVAGLTFCIPYELIFPRKCFSEYQFPWSKFLWEILRRIYASHEQATFS